MRKFYPSRTASALLAISTVLVVVGFAMIFTGAVQVGRLVGMAGVLGAIGSARVSHARKPR